MKIRKQVASQTFTCHHSIYRKCCTPRKFWYQIMKWRSHYWHS